VKTHATSHRSARKRPFTREELATILSSPQAAGGTTLGDAIRLLVLSAVRAEELARMKVADLRLDHPTPHIDLKGSKTAAARRLVPVHIDALSIFLRRAKGKATGDYLFHELPTPPEGSAMERGQPLTKAFGRLRLKLGIDPREPGARQADVDMHSLRRFAIASMRDALNRGEVGFSMRTVAQVVGHDTGGLGLSMTSMYAGEEPLEAKSKAVASVRLPTLPS
jgi:integrase